MTNATRSAPPRALAAAPHRGSPALLVLLLLVASVAGGCRSAAFEYRMHETPRLSVIHRPLHPSPDEPVRVIATAEAGAASVAEIRVTLLSAAGTQEEVCTGTSSCVLEAPPIGEASQAIYGAQGTDAGGAEILAPSSYLFTIGEPPGSEEVLLLRKPFIVGQNPFDVVLVRDASYPDEAALLADAEALLYDGVLSDPAYRWRDDQLAFHLVRYAGRTTDRSSGLQNRCGQQPWQGSPHLAEAEAAVGFAEALGVIHRQSSFRDCAGLGAVTGSARFSAFGGSPARFQHELAHALFGLGDEYNEPESSRRMPAGPEPVGLDCECCDPDPDSGGGVVTLPGGGTGTVPLPNPLDPCVGKPSCVGWVKPAECYPAEEACPPLEGSCVHPNVFRSRGECDAAAVAAAAHPGVEVTTDPAHCRVLCDNSDAGNPCPCDPTPGRVLWILDVRQPPGAGPAEGDVMSQDADPLPNWHGAACDRCTETTFCLGWERDRGRTQAQAEAHCLDP